jgi:glycerol-3-phosphate dehydrogenase (NAD(P)+)
MNSVITILGDGAWGTAIAHTLATAGHNVTLWCYDTTVAHDIATNHENKQYLPGVPLNPTIKVTTSVEQALTSNFIFVAIPVTFLRATLTQCAHYKNNAHEWILLSKGIEQNSLALPSDILIETINPTHWCIFSGPTYARDIVLQQLSGFTATGTDIRRIHRIQELFPGFCTFEYSKHVHAIQLYGALKNILALGIVILEGAGYADNTQALFFTRMFNEITTLVVASGGDAQTAFSLAAIGDSILTGYGKQSKNKKLGLLLGAGNTFEQALEQFPTAPESVNTLVAAQQLLHAKKLPAPYTQALYNYVYGTATIHDFINSLFTTAYSTLN